jgi:glycosyltransferase involved in cell wall biosynthesis
MEAYLDSLLYRTQEEEATFDLLAVGDCDVPAWLTEDGRLTLARYSAPETTGLGRTRVAAEVTRQYLKSGTPNAIRQITQPRWHAPGVLLGAFGFDVEVCTRASASLFDEYREAPSPVRAWLVNNAIGRAIFLADKVYTPRFGGIEVPRWAPAERIVEERIVNGDRFSPDTPPREGLFSADKDRVLTVGRISRRKGIDLLLDVADRLKDVAFAVVGPVGDDDLSKTVDASPNIRLHPPVDYVEMPGLYAAADLVLSVSRLEWGGVSRAMLEGKSMGRPVVALDRGQAASVADEAVPPDPDVIAAAVCRQLD